MDERGPKQVNVANDDQNDYLDIFGDQPGLFRLYTQICLCFSVSDDSSHSTIIDTLTKGLERLSASYPWLAGQVVNEGSNEGPPYDFKIKPLENFPRLVVKDLRDDPSIPTMDAIRQASFPFSMLDENIIAPRNTLPGDFDKPAPVLLLQANFTTGGLLLTIVAQHNVMDMTGQGHVMNLLSKACHNESFTNEELSSGNLARHNLIPLLDDTYQPGPELHYQILKPVPSAPISNVISAQLPIPPKCSWAYFIFSPASLAALKSIATEGLTSGFVSTDDTISAFIWQSVLRARLPRLNPAAEVTFARAVNVRQYLDIPQTYPGLVQNMTYHTYTLQKLIDEPLGGVASNLRSALDPKTSNLGYKTSALATVLRRSADKSGINVTATLDLSSDIMLSSWAQVNCYDLDFNLGLGKPEAVRRPQFYPVESLLYLMPKTLDGEIAAGLCLRDEDMERLKADRDFVKYGRCVG